MYKQNGLTMNYYQRIYELAEIIDWIETILNKHGYTLNQHTRNTRKKLTVVRIATTYKFYTQQPYNIEPNFEEDISNPNFETGLEKWLTQLNGNGEVGTTATP